MFPTREEIEPDCRMSDLDRILNDIFYSKNRMNQLLFLHVIIEFISNEWTSATRYDTIRVLQGVKTL